MSRPERYYTFYDNKTDKILWFGTANELVAKGEFKNISCVRTLVANINRGKNRSVTVVIDDEVLDD